MSHRHSLTSISTLCCLLFPTVFAPLPAQARERVPVTAPRGGGVNILLPDMELPGNPDFVDPTRDPVDTGWTGDPGRTLRTTLERRILAYDVIGGDDERVRDWSSGLSFMSMDIAVNGDIYAAMQLEVPGSGDQISVYRSQDGGNTWADWGTLAETGLGGRAIHPSLDVVEGVVSECYVAYSRTRFGGDYEIVVASEPLSSPTATFATRTVAMSQTGVSFFEPDITSDVGAFPSFYLYLVASAAGGGQDIWFNRSLTMNSGWEPEYMIANNILGDRDYLRPTISYGLDDFVHVAWHLQSRGGAFQSAIRYRRVPLYADGGLVSWGNIESLTATTGTPHHTGAYVYASLTTTTVAIASTQVGSSVETPSVLVSGDEGVSFVEHTLPGDSPGTCSGILEQPGTGQWIVGLKGSFGDGISRSSATDLSSWSSYEPFADTDYRWPTVHGSPIALDPSRAYQVAMLWNSSGIELLADGFYFDAEWFDGPGYPNIRPGFPVRLDYTPFSSPALVDMDDDPELEIVFTDTGNYIQVLNPDGTSVPGWPVLVPDLFTAQPVAVGDLNGDGKPTVVAGDLYGNVHAFDMRGQPEPGWPHDMFPGNNDLALVVVSIGALGGPYARTVVACANDRLEFINYRGSPPLDTFGWNVVSGSTLFPGPAIGDINGNGVADVVVQAFDSGQTSIFAVEMYNPVPTLSRDLPAFRGSTDRLVLADLDLDGDVEIISASGAAGSLGYIYVLDDNGSDFPGWPVNTGLVSELQAPAVAHIRGGANPQIVVAAESGTVFAYNYDGTPVGGYPVDAGGIPGADHIIASPIIGEVTGSADVLVGARDGAVHAWDNLGFTFDGWPKQVFDLVDVGLAMGDLDNDGSMELVVLTGSVAARRAPAAGELIVIDLNTAPGPEDTTWPMYAYNPQRTGCFLCIEDVVTSTGPAETSGSQLNFDAPAPNPMGARTVFRFTLPDQALVSLVVYDLRGRRIKTVLQEDAGPGEHTVAWGGRDERGIEVSAGTYFARLLADGPGAHQSKTWKVMVVR